MTENKILNSLTFPLLGLLIMAFVVSSCNNENNEEQKVTNAAENNQNVSQPLTETELISEFDRLKKEMQEDEDQDIKKLNKLIALSIDLVNNYPENETAPEKLDLAAQLSYAKGNARQSVEYYNRLINEYPDFAGLEYSYFMYANHLDLDLRKIDEATKAYQEFIERFPNSQFIPEAKMRLENIDMSMEDIINQSGN